MTTSGGCSNEDVFNVSSFWNIHAGFLWLGILDRTEPTMNRKEFLKGLTALVTGVTILDQLKPIKPIETEFIEQYRLNLEKMAKQSLTKKGHNVDFKTIR